jgi:hypothetical protein
VEVGIQTENHLWPNLVEGVAVLEAISMEEGGISFVRWKKWEAGGGSSDGSGAAQGRRET